MTKAKWCVIQKTKPQTNLVISLKINTDGWVGVFFPVLFDDLAAFRIARAATSRPADPRGQIHHAEATNCGRVMLLELQATMTTSEKSVVVLHSQRQSRPPTQRGSLTTRTNLDHLLALKLCVTPEPVVCPRR